MTPRNVLRSLAGLACIFLSTGASARFISVDGPGYGVSCSSYRTVDECRADEHVILGAADSVQLSVVGVQLTFAPGVVSQGTTMAVAGPDHLPSESNPANSYPVGLYNLDAGYMYNWGPNPLGQSTDGSTIQGQVMVLVAADDQQVGPISSSKSAFEVDFNYASNVSCSGASFTYNGITYTPNGACAGADNAFFFNFDPVKGLVDLFSAPGNWSSTGAPTPVPEPSTLALWSVALVLLFIVSRRRRSAKTLL